MSIKELIKASKTTTIAHGGSIKAAEKMLLPGEQALYAFTGNVNIIPSSSSLGINHADIHNKITGVIVLTTTRLYFVNQVLGAGQSKQLSLKDITSMNDKSNLFGLMVLRITGITETFEIDMNRTLYEDFMSSLNRTINSVKLINADSQKGSTNQYDDLEKLAELRDKGIITQEEFSEKKRQILGL